MTKSEQLLQLREECLNCKKCDLCKTRTNVVFGVGSPESNVMFIGEGPGHDEDMSGVPFVGRAGKLLDLMLDASGFSRDENIYIANIVKCRPPENRDPKPDEQDCCIKWLEKQIEIINPKVIVCLGRIAAWRIIDPNMKITREHGQLIEKDGRLYMAMLHPSALLRNPNQKPEAFADFLRLRDHLKRSGEF